jgi:hypothetical protein
MRTPVAFTLTIGSAALAQSIPISMVAHSDRAYPGLPPGATILQMTNPPVLGPDAQVAFVAPLSAPGGAPDALCLETATGPLTLTRVGLTIPGDPSGATVGTIERPLSLGAGRVGTLFHMFPTSGNGHTAYYIASASALTPIVAFNQAAPVPSPVGIFGNIAYQAWNGGFTAFACPIVDQSGAMLADALWYGVPGSLQALAIQGSPAPGFPGQSFLQLLASEGSLVMNDSGSTAFPASVGNGGAFHLFGGTPGNLRLIARAGQAVTGGTLSNLASPSIDAAGDVAFTALLVSPSGNRQGIWISSASSFTPVAQHGDPAPGTTAVFDRVPYNLPAFDLDDTGRFAFIGSLTGPGVTAQNNMGLWRGVPGNARLIARMGDPAPGMPAGVVYDFLGAPYAMNSRGQLVFQAYLAGTGVTSINNIALFYADPDGRVAPIVRRAQTITASAEPITIYSFAFLGTPGGQDGLPACLSESGRFAFSADLSNGPGGVSAGSAALTAQLPDACYANCDSSTTAPVLNVADFGCFLDRFAAADPLANCDLSTAPPVLNVNDFLCFLNRFAAGCP